MKKIFVSGLMLLTVLGLAGNACAEFHPFKLLRRGATNILTAPLEIPKQTIASFQEGQKKTPHFSAWVFAGFFKGIVYAIGRMGSGAFDVLTSNFDRNGDSLINPEYVFDEWPGSAPKEESSSERPADSASQQNQ